MPHLDAQPWIRKIGWSEIYGNLEKNLCSVFAGKHQGFPVHVRLNQPNDSRVTGWGLQFSRKGLIALSPRMRRQGMPQKGKMLDTVGGSMMISWLWYIFLLERFKTYIYMWYMYVCASICACVCNIWLFFFRCSCAWNWCCEWRSSDFTGIIWWWTHTTVGVIPGSFPTATGYE